MVAPREAVNVGVWNKFVLGGLCLVMAGCGAPLGAVVHGAARYPGVLSTIDPLAAATATPFLPLEPTITPAEIQATPTPPASPAPANPWGDYPGPIEPSAIEIPPPMPLIIQSDRVVNLVILGSDARPGESVGRADTILIVSLDPDTGTAILLSLPRDLYVYIPGWRVDRVNVADVRGGADLVALTLRYNLGLEIDHFVRVNMSGFTTIVDLLGGIQVQSTGYLRDECGGVWREYGVGSYSMDGFTALCYVRMRKTSSDFDRLRRQQEVLLAVFRKVINLNGLARLPELWGQFNRLVQTDMSLDQVLRLAPLAATLGSDPERIRRYSVDGGMVSAWTVPYSGAAVLLPHHLAIQSMLDQAFPDAGG
jgi:polyisoprenyl-teichoic acid--peptidoglycan teichoic acid transferase